MRARVGKRFRFNAAHYLTDYDGPCENVHGHTYEVEIAVEGPVHPQTGMVVDFSALKDSFNERVHGVLDHQLLNDHIGVPSTENVAAWVMSRVRQDVPDVVAVRVWEGPMQYAEVRA